MSHPNSATQPHHAESSTEDMPWLFLDTQVYRRLGRVTIRNSSGTTRVRHVIVSNYGIFVLEENSETGTFQANPGTNWTQYQDELSHEIPNPVRQVANQAYALQEALSLPSSHFNTGVFFTGGHVYLKGEVPDNVVSQGYTEYVKSFKKVILSDAQVEEIVNKIKSLGAVARPAHKQQARPHPHGAAHAKPAESRPHAAAHPAQRPAPSSMKSLAYGLMALLLGALVTSLLVSWLN